MAGRKPGAPPAEKKAGNDEASSSAPSAVDPLGSERDRAGLILYAGHLLSIWGIALSNGLLGLALLRSWWRFGFPLGRLGSWNESKRRVVRPLVAYSVFLAASIAVSYQPRASFTELGEIFNLCTLPLALLLVRGERTTRRFFDLILVMMVLLSLQGVWQYFFTERGSLQLRIPGLFSHYMTFSGVLVLGVCILAGRLATRAGWTRVRYWLALALIGGTLYLTLTRHAWLATLVALSMAVWIGARRLFPIFVSAVLVAVLLIAQLSPEGWQRLTSIVDLDNPSNYDRVCMTWAGLSMIGERPLLGTGPRMVERLYPIYRHPTAPSLEVKHLHNTFVQMAAERGLLSVAAYIWLMLVAFNAALRGYRRQGGIRGPTADLYAGVMIAIVAFNFSGLFEANWRDTEVQTLMLFLLAVPFCLKSEATVTGPGLEPVKST